MNAFFELTYIALCHAGRLHRPLIHLLEELVLVCWWTHSHDFAAKNFRLEFRVHIKAYLHDNSETNLQDSEKIAELQKARPSPSPFNVGLEVPYASALI